jgi:hypothetical protein
MTLKTYNLPSGRLKKRLWRSRWSDISRGRNATWTHFLHPEDRIKRLGWSRLSDVLSRRMALKTHNLRLNVVKNDFCGRWSDVSRCRKAMRMHFLHLCHKKIFLDEVACDNFSKRMGLRTHNQPSGRLKNEFGWDDELMFKMWKGQKKSFSASFHQKKRLARSRLSDVLFRR